MTSESNKEYSVNWKNHMNHIRKVFDQLLNTNELTDVTLCCEGKKIKAHKMLLSACSAYFRDTFKDVPCQHPVIILYGVDYNVLSDILHFIYKGEVSVDTSKLDLFLKTAQLLQISGLTDAPAIPTSNNPSENERNQEPVSTGQATEESFGEPLSQLPATSEETNKGVKRSRPKETEVPRTKLHKQESDTLFVSDVKCEPSELVQFGDPLEDPLLQSEQLNETKEFFGTAATPVEDEFTIETNDLYETKRFGEDAPCGKKMIPPSTLKCKTSVWTTFQKFCETRGYALNGSTSTEVISEILADWGLNMRKTNGTDYKEGVVKTIWNVTAKMLQEMFYDKYKIKFDPFRDIEFKKARDSRDIKRQQLQSRPDKRKARFTTLNETERHKMYSIWDENTPSGLQRKFFHIAAFELSWKIQEATNCLLQYFREEYDMSGIFTGRIEYNPYFGGMGEEGRSKWLVANTKNPDVCPVRLFQKLMSKRGINSNINTERMFLTQNPNWNKTETSAWYKDSPVGKNQIGVWIKEGAEKIGIDTKRFKITNYTKRASRTKQPNI